MLVKELLEQVGTKISTGDVTSRVVDSLVEKELNARKDAFLVVLTKLDETRKAGLKIKPDGETWAVDEKGAPSKEPIKTYSKARKEELEKNLAEQKKLEEALEKALGGDFSKVKELAAKGSKPEAA